MKKKLLAALLASALAAGMLPTSACAASDYTTANATLISLTDSSATAKGKYTGYEIDGTDVSITAAGTYVFSGDCDNGSITVKKGVTGVTIVLNGLTLTNDDSAAITLNKTAEASLIAAAGTTNTVADTEGSSDENAAVKVKSGAALAIGGTGTLTVDGNAKNGIKGAADAVITVAEVKLNINAVSDGLSCDDELNITGGTLSITAGGDAVKASPDTGENPDTTSLGNVTISGGTLTLNAAEDGIQADGDLTISGGTFDVTANGGHTTALTDDSASCKGFKAGKTLTVTGGTLTVDSADDALHASTDVTILGGTLTLATGDDGVHADNDLVIGTKGASSTSTPRINITASYEGLEGTTVTVYSGDIDVVASDDGVNAANSTLGERSDKYAINIAGGDLYIDAGSDGLDSNNDISMTGGKVEVYGADAMMDAAIDYDGTFTLSGGTLFGAGMEPSAGTQAYIAVGETSPSGGGMGGGPNGQGGGQGMTPPGDANGSTDGTNGNPPTPPGDANGSTDGNRPTPPSFSGNTDGTGTRPEKPSDNGQGGQPGGAPANRESALGIKEGSVITVQDSSGKTLYTATALGSMSSVIFSSADIEEGETYTVLVDGTSVGTAEAKLGTADSSSANSNFKPGQGGQPNQNGSQATVGSFKDVPQNSWFAGAVQYVTSNSLMNGTSTTAFSPNATMSRGMLMTVLARYAGESTEGGTVWYEKGMNWAKNKGISDGSAPNRNITREQLAAMLYRYAGEPDGTADLSAYTDAGSVSAYAEKAVQWCVKNGILTGKTSSTLAPKATATRAECAAMLQRFASLTK